MRTEPMSGPIPVLPASTGWPLFDVASSRAIEAREQQARPAGALMRAAGHGVARWALATAPHARTVWIACGPGGNGGDGLHAAAELQRAGRSVVASLHASRERLPADAQEGLQRALDAGVRLTPESPAGAFDLCIDALLGIGASRAPDGSIAQAIAALNALRAPCLAVDLPSGLAADTGAPLGQAVVQADATLSLLTLKPGLFTAAGRRHAGRIWFDGIGASVRESDRPVARLTSCLDLRAVATARRHDQHKGSFGDVVVIGGAPGMVGAARLAAHAALAAGAGRTIVSLLDARSELSDATRPEWLWRREAWRPGASPLEDCTVVCGCGGGDEVRRALPAVLSRAARLVLDADGLNAVAADPMLASLLEARALRGGATVLTPHPLEAARLLGGSTADVQADRLQASQSLARRFGAVVVLKGSGTLIARADGPAAINSTGDASLSSGGTGDVLAGWIGGLWAQQGAASAGAPSAGDASGFGSAVASVWLHGAAAEAGRTVAVRALDLVDAMRALRDGSVL